MTWSYDPLSVGSDPVMQVRFLIQDTAVLPNTTSGIVQNEEIEFCLTVEPNIWFAAARACEAAATNVLQLQSRSTSAVHVSYLQPSQIHQRANYLRQRGMSHQGIRSGATSVSAQKALELDPEVPQPMFRVGAMDNRYAGTTTGVTDPTTPVPGF